MIKRAKRTDTTRTTLLLSTHIDYNLEVLALTKGDTPKSQLIEEAIVDYLKKHGYPTDKKVAFTVTKD